MIDPSLSGALDTLIAERVETIARFAVAIRVDRKRPNMVDCYAISIQSQVQHLRTDLAALLAKPQPDGLDTLIAQVIALRHRQLFNACSDCDGIGCDHGQSACVMLKLLNQMAALLSPARPQPCDTCRRLQEKLSLNEQDHLARVERLEHELAHERSLHGGTIDERDTAQEWADKLAYAVADQDVIGEHSSLNNPWLNALEILDSRGDPTSTPEQEQR